jgi:anaerobic dimethyl sulfoxide reductase subunit C (anchor subunit)
MVLRKDPGCEEAQCDVLYSTIRGISITALILLGVQILTLPLLAGHLTSTAVPAAAKSAELLFIDFQPLLIMRIVLVFLGAGLFSLFLYRKAEGLSFQKALSYLVYGAFALVLVSEVLGRYLFYASQVRVGV